MVTAPPSITIKKTGLVIPWSPMILIILTASLLYANIFSVPFIFDGKLLIEEKLTFKNSSDFYSLRHLLRPRGIVQATFAYNYETGKLNVFGYHLFNLMIHIFNGLLAYFLAHALIRGISRIPSTPAGKPSLHYLPLVAALIFLSHPIQTESITYIIQRPTSVSAMFFMGSALFYLRGRWMQQRKENFWNLSWVLFAFALLFGIFAFLSKQNAACLPFALLLMEFIYTKNTRSSWKMKIFWFAPVFLVWTLFILFSMGLFQNRTGFAELAKGVSSLSMETDSVSRWNYLCTQFNVLAIYLRLLFFPAGQNLDHLYPFNNGFFDGWTPLSFFLLAGIAALGAWQFNKKPLLSFGLFWFFITLSVESSIFPIRDALFEHRLYLPLFGFSLLGAGLLFSAFHKKPKTLTAVSVLLLLALGGATYFRNNLWRDPVLLWTDVVTKNPLNYRGYNNLGYVLMEKGKLEEAEKYFSKSLALNADYSVARYNLADVMERQENFAGAAAQYFQMSNSPENKAKGHYNLAKALLNQGNFRGALTQLTEAVRLNPAFYQAFYQLGKIWIRMGNPMGALEAFDKALSLKPDSAEAYNERGWTLARMGRLSEAVSSYRQALRLNPQFTEARNNLETLLQQRSRQ